MTNKIVKIYRNAQKSLFTDINGQVNKFTFGYIFIKIITPLLSAGLVYFNRDVFIDDPKIIGTLLSLFSGLMFGVLVKIPDKFKDIEPKENESRRELLKKKQVKNYLKLFMYSLSYSILVALFSIFFVVLTSFFPSLVKLNLTKYTVDLENYNFHDTLKCGLILIFRFLFAMFILNFIFFILKAVTNLYEFMLYEFNKIKTTDNNDLKND